MPVAQEPDVRSVSVEARCVRLPEKAADVAALAVHIMTNTALTGATYDIDGGQQLIAR